MPDMPFFSTLDPSFQNWLYSFSQWFQDFINNYNSMANSLNSQIREVLTDLSGDAPVSLFVPFNATFNDEKQWYQIDASIPSWKVSMDAGFYYIDFAAAGAPTPIVWTHYASCDATGLWSFVMGPGVEIDPVFSAWLAATPPLYAETDPWWGAWLAAAHSFSFNVASWVLSGSNYYINFNHGLNVSTPTVTIKSSSELVYVNKIEIVDANNVKIWIPAVPDIRFIGLVDIGKA
jgi:hypothetical protein